MKHLLYVLPVLAMTSGIAYAQSRPTLPVADIASELGVAEADLTDCLAANMPAQPPIDRPADGAEKSGSRPAPQAERSPAPEMISCLQAHNSEITADMLDDVMQKYRPERPAR